MSDESGHAGREFEVRLQAAHGNIVRAEFWSRYGLYYACSAGFLLSFTGSMKQAPEHNNMFFTTYDLYDILSE